MTIGPDLPPSACLETASKVCRAARQEIRALFRRAAGCADGQKPGPCPRLDRCPQRPPAASAPPCGSLTPAQEPGGQARAQDGPAPLSRAAAREAMLLAVSAAA